jgi:hypothetical protein
MNIFEFAMEKEKFSETYYRQLASKTRHKGLANICTMLADEEVKHYHAIEAMKADSPANFAQSTVLGDAKKIFESIRNSAEKFDLDISELELYKKAQDIETQSRNFYLEKARQSELPAHKQIFTALAEEEKKHYFIVGNIIDFISRPQTWLENAEWYHLDEY